MTRTPRNKPPLKNKHPRAMLTLVEVGGSPPRLDVNVHDLSLIPFELSLAQLTGDEVTEKRLRYGTAIYDEVTYYFDAGSWADMMKSWLIPAISRIGRVPESLPTPPEGTPNKDITEVAMLIFRYLRSNPRYESPYVQVLQLLFKMLAVFQIDIDELALTIAAMGRPKLRQEVPELQNLEIYGRYAEVVRRADFGNTAPETNKTTWQDPPAQVMFAVSEILTRSLYFEEKLFTTAPGFGRAPSAEDVRG
jgi:hypothetical protein